MIEKVSIYGAGRTGTHAAVYLLKKLFLPIVLYDENTSYAQGIALDVMQSTVLEPGKSLLYAAQSLDEFSNAELLIVSENSMNKVDVSWHSIAKKASLVLLATQNPAAIHEAIQAGISRNKIIGVHGFADASLLRSHVATEIDIARSNVHAMTFGKTGSSLGSRPDFVRVNGIPVNEIQHGSFESSLQKTRADLSTLEKEGTQHYRLAAACAELVQLLLNNQPIFIPATSEDSTIPALIDLSGVLRWYPQLMENNLGTKQDGAAP